MLKKMLAKTWAKKTSIFIAMFAITCIILAEVTSLHRLEEARAGQVDFFQQMQGQAASTMVILAQNPSSSAQEPGGYIVAELPPTALSEYPASADQPLNPAHKVRIETLQLKPQLKVPAAAGFVYCDSIPLSYELQQYTYNQCQDKGLEYELVLALMWRESRFQTDAVGSNTNGTKDSGIMQINDVNRGWLRNDYGITDLLDPVQNIAAGTILLGDLTEKYGQNGALMAYQYGEAGMQNKYKQGIYTNGQIAMLMDKKQDFHTMIHGT